MALKDHEELYRNLVALKGAFAQKWNVIQYSEEVDSGQHGAMMLT